jgi:hypothetical protein
MSGTGAIIGVVGALVVLIVYFSVIPLLGDRIDSAADITGNDYATGTLTFSGVVADGQTINVSTDRYEFDTDASVTSGNIRIDLNASGTPNVTAVYAAVMFTANVTTNDTVGVGVSRSNLVVTLTADAAGTAGNSIATTDTCTNAAFGAATLTGGSTASAWASDDITTASDLWEDNGSMIAVAMIIVVVSVILLVLRGAF